MKRSVVLVLTYFLILFIFMSSGYAQAPDIEWEKTIGGPDLDGGYCVQQLDDGGYIIVGETKSFGHGKSDAYLIKLNSKGDTLWTKTFGGPFWDEATCVQQTSDGGLIVTGQYYSDENNSDLYLIKTNRNGDTLWIKKIHKKNDKIYEKGQWIEETTDGGFIIVGRIEDYYSKDLGYSIGNVFLVKTNSAGDTLWTRTYGDSLLWDESACVKETDDGNFIIVGTSENVDYWERHILLIKTNNTGDTLWTKIYENRPYEEEPYTIELTSDGGYLIAGHSFNDELGIDQLFLFKVDSNGDSLWMKLYDNLWASSIKKLSDGGYIVAGVSHDSDTEDFNILLMRTDDFGDTLWTKIIGGDSADYASSIDITNDNGYVILGSTNSFGAGNYDIYVIKLAPDLTDINRSDKILPNQFILQQNYPNPFNPTTTINYTIPKSAKVSLTIFDVLGQKIETLVNKRQNPGNYSVHWDASGYPSGIYFYQIKAGKYSQIKKMLLIK